MTDPSLEKTLKYKLIKNLTKGTYSNNPLVKSVSSGIMGSLKNIHNTFGKDNSNEEMSKKTQFENNEKTKTFLKKEIQKSIEQYKEKCEVIDEKEYLVIVSLLDSILRHTDNQPIFDKIESLKYIKQIIKLACNII